jgi:hypothetical protein
MVNESSHNLVPFPRPTVVVDVAAVPWKVWISKDGQKLCDRGVATFCPSTRGPRQWLKVRYPTDNRLVVNPQGNFLQVDQLVQQIQPSLQMIQVNGGHGGGC